MEWWTHHIEWWYPYGLCPPKTVATSAVEAEFGMLIMNTQVCCIMWLIFEEFCYPQLPTLLYPDNSIAAGITNKSQKTGIMIHRQVSLLNCQSINRKQFNAGWYPRQKDLGDYYTKHDRAVHHRTPLTFTWVFMPSSLWWCVQTLQQAIYIAQYSRKMARCSDQHASQCMPIDVTLTHNKYKHC